jgi:hypothetical protein
MDQVLRLSGRKVSAGLFREDKKKKKKREMMLYCHVATLLKVPTHNSKNDKRLYTKKNTQGKTLFHRHTYSRQIHRRESWQD